MRTADRAPDTLCVQVLTPRFPQPKPEVLRFHAYRSNECGLEGKRCIKAAAKLLLEPQAHPATDHTGGIIDLRGGGVHRLLQELGMIGAPPDQQLPSVEDTFLTASVYVTAIFNYTPVIGRAHFVIFNYLWNSPYLVVPRDP
mmetsp:Transcript_3703/g.9254  ORF Transcript_3703/g.9254 Transcript_3703/m.9254 type:complete len:142 (-) Transcript_3703:50-475(-)